MRAFILVTVLLSSLIPPAAANAGHRVILQGKGPNGGRLVVLDEKGKIDWQTKWGGIHDIHVLETGNIMVQRMPNKVVELDGKSGEVLWTYDAAISNGNKDRRVEVHAFQPLKDGNVMIAESGPARIIEVNRDGKLLKEIKLTVNKPNAHTDTRLVRKLGNGNYLVCHEGDGAVREYSPEGYIVWEFMVPMFGKKAKGGHGPDAFGNKCFAAIRLQSGNTLIATGNGHSVLEVDHHKKIVWKITQDELPGIRLAWVTTLQVLPNGNYVVGNCHAGPGQPLLIEIEPKTKRVVWKLDRFKDFGNNVSNSQVLNVKNSLR